MEVLIHLSENQLTKKFFWCNYFLSIKKDSFLKKTVFLYKKFFIFLFDNLPVTLDPDPNWANILDPDPNVMYLDPQHCTPDP